MRKPINQEAHALLTDQGAAVLYDQVEPDFDDGTPESGPGIWGHPACDVYATDSHYIGIDWRGLELKPRDFAYETYCDEQLRGE